MDKTKRLDDYIASLTRALRGVPGERVAQELAEVRGHIGQLIDHKRNSGLSDDAAAAEAIAQFGTAKSVGRKLRASWLRTNPLARGHFLTGFAIGFTIDIVWLLATVRICSGLDIYHRSALWNITFIAVLKLQEIFGFFGLGWIVARVSPKQAPIAVAATFILDITLTIVSRYNQGVAELPWNLAFEFAEIAFHVCLAVYGAKVAQRWLVRRAERLA